MQRLFGPASASLVDKMTEDNCVSQCREKTKTFMGEDKAKEFDDI